MNQRNVTIVVVIVLLILVLLLANTLFGQQTIVITPTPVPAATPNQIIVPIVPEATPAPTVIIVPQATPKVTIPLPSSIVIPTPFPSSSP